MAFRVLVTGDKGLVGRHAVAALESRGFTTVGFDHVDGLSLSDSAALDVAVRGCSAVVHTAAIVSDDLGTPREIHEVNVVGTFDLLNAAVSAGVRSIVLFSSVQVSGLYEEAVPARLPIDESMPGCATRAYGLSKLLCERMGRAFSDRHGIRVVALRPTWVIDEAFMRAAASDEALLGESWRGRLWVHAEDVGELVWRAVTSDVAAGVFYASAPDLAGSLTTVDLVSRFFPSSTFETPADPFASIVSSRRAEDVFGWKPRRRWPR